MDWKYEMIIYWSNEDHAYIVEVPELPSLKIRLEN